MQPTILDNFRVGPRDGTQLPSLENPFEAIEGTDDEPFTFEVILKEDDEPAELRSITLKIDGPVKRVQVGVIKDVEDQPEEKINVEDVPDGEEFTVVFNPEVEGYKFRVRVVPEDNSSPTVDVAGVEACVKPQATTSPAPGTSVPTEPRTTAPQPVTSAPVTTGPTEGTTAAPPPPGTTAAPPPPPGTTAAPPPPGTTAAPPPPPGTTATTAVPVTVCAEDMVPTSPNEEYYDTEDLPGNKVLQVTDFPDDVYVDSVPTDQNEDGQPDTEVFVPEEKNAEGVVTLQPGERYVLITETTETTVTTPGQPAGTQPVDDLVETLDDVVETTVGDVTVTIFEVPEDGVPTPVFVGPTESILKESQPEQPGDNAPVETFGPTVVTISKRPAGEPEPTEIVFCEKPTTPTTAPTPTTSATTAPTTSGPPPTTPFICKEDMEPTTLANFRVGPRDGTQLPSLENPFEAIEGTDDEPFTFEVILKEDDEPAELRSITLKIDGPVKRVQVGVIKDVEDQPEEKINVEDVPDGEEFTVVFNPEVEGYKFRVRVVPEDNSSPAVDVAGVEACVKPQETTTPAPATSPSPAPTTSATTTPRGETCEDMTEMTSFLVTPDSIDVQPAGGSVSFTEDGIVLNYPSSADGNVVIEVYMPVEGTLILTKLTGDFISYQIELPTEGNSVAVSDVTGKNVLLPGDASIFKEEYDEGYIVFSFRVTPGVAGTITVEKLIVCSIPQEDLCRISKENVEAELGFSLTDNAFGLTRDGQEIDLGPLVYITDGITIKGYCYECECKGNNVLECTKENCDTCPTLGPWSECSAECGAGQRTRSTDEIGVPDTCNTTETEDCFSQCTTTPAPCLSAWSDWSPCQGCVQRRTRDCTPECVAAGTCPDDSRTQETRACPCTTTPTTPRSTLECAENEVFACRTNRMACEETCVAYRAGENETCVERDDTDCAWDCYCELGMYRNSEGKCVPDSECNCYLENGSPVPIGYIYYPTACYKCICTEEGEECEHDDTCCEVGQWEDWSPCSATCGPGVKSRSRVVSGNCNDIPDEETEVCDIPCECEDGETRYFEESCEEAVCIMGQFEVNEIVCEEVEYDCNNDTHVMIDDPENPCCQICIEIKYPCRPVQQEVISLNYTSPVLNAVCVSEPISISRCEGSCAPSSQTMQYMTDNNGIFQLVDDAGSCECCKPNVVTRTVDFDCGGVKETRDVPEIASCECMACAGGI